MDNRDLNFVDNTFIERLANSIPFTSEILKNSNVVLIEFMQRYIVVKSRLADQCYEIVRFDSTHDEEYIHSEYFNVNMLESSCVILEEDFMSQSEQYCQLYNEFE